jgi:hypothetical protein
VESESLRGALRSFGGSVKRTTWARLAIGALGATLAGCGVINKIDGVAQADHLERSGTRAEATVLEIWETGMSVNHDPVVGFLLEVHPQDGEPYQARTKLLISRLSIPQIQPGALLPVRFDPQDPARVSLDRVAMRTAYATPPPLPMPTPLPRAADIEGEKQRLLATGIPGTVTILQAAPLGLFDADGRPAYDLVVNVVVPGHAPMQGPTRTAVAKERERYFHAGQQLPIKADPENPKNFAVDWDLVE